MKLCSLILQEHFGENVKIVGEDLFKSKSKSISGITQTTRLTKRKVIKANNYEISNWIWLNQ